MILPLEGGINNNTYVSVKSKRQTGNINTVEWEIRNQRLTYED